MLAIRIIPTLLCRGTALVKGERFDSRRIVGHVLQAAKIYQERGVDELIVLDVEATADNRGPDLQMVEALTRDCFMPITVGGGVRTVDDVRRLLECGADKVAVCTNATAILPLASRRYGAQALVAAIDTRGAHCYAQCGAERLSLNPAQLAVSYQILGAGEILLSSIERDGTLAGYDLELIRVVSEVVSIPVIASGGCSGYEDMYQALQAGASAVAAGALWQWTESTPARAAAYLRDKGVEVRLEAKL